MMSLYPSGIRIPYSDRHLMCGMLFKNSALGALIAVPEILRVLR
jgi:hypothetical protein